MNKALFTLLVVFITSPAFAVDDEVKARISESLKTLVPNTEISSVSPSPVPGLYRVIVDGQVLYMSKDGRYLVQGSVYDVKQRKDLTANVMAGIRHKLLADVEPASMITFAPPKDKIRHEVTVFTDIDCGYCRKLHSQIEEYNEYGIAVHYMFFPRAGLNSHSYDKAVSVWCAEDQKAALTNAKQGTEPKPLQCDNPVKAQYQLGRQVGITGTPGIIAEDGTLLPGYLPPATLVQRLDALKADEAQGG